MEITPLGYIFLTVYFLSFFFPVKYLFVISIFSCIFQASSVFNFTLAGGARGLPPWIIGSLFLIIRNFSFSSLWRDLRKKRFIQYITFFVVFAISASLLFPHFGWNIQQPDFDMITGIKRSISFGMGHITLISYVLLWFLSIYSLYRIREKIPNDLTEKIFIVSILTVCVVGLWEFTSKTTGTNSFPYRFFYNNPGYAQLYMQGAGSDLMRLNSTFVEPSFCGGFLAASFWAVMSMDKLNYKWLYIILIGLTLILNLSGTGIVSFLVGIPVFLYLQNKKWGGGVSLLDDYYRSNTYCYRL